MNKIFKIGAIASVVGVTAANAALTAPTIDTTDFMTIAGSVLAALGVFFGVRKALGLLY